MLTLAAYVQERLSKYVNVSVSLSLSLSKETDIRKLPSRERGGLITGVAVASNFHEMLPKVSRASFIFPHKCLKCHVSVSVKIMLHFYPTS